MAIKSYCPAGHKFSAPDHYAGRTVKCPVCSAEVTIGASGTPAAAAGTGGGAAAVRPPPLPRGRELAGEVQRTKSPAVPPAAPPPLPPKRPPPVKPELSRAPPAAPARTSPSAAPPPSDSPTGRKAPAAGSVAVPAISSASLPRGEPAAVATPWHVAQAGEFEPEEEALPEGTEGVRGYEPEPQRRWHAWYLACALAGVAVLGMVPGVREIVRHYTAEESSGIGNWAYVVLCVGVLQLGYALLLAQAPDWSTTMVVAVLSLVVMAAYAAVLSVSLTGNRDSEMVTWLQLGDLLAGREAARWCLVMLGVTSLVCYFLGRFGMAWIQQYTTLAALQAGK